MTRRLRRVVRWASLGLALAVVSPAWASPAAAPEPAQPADSEPAGAAAKPEAEAQADSGALVSDGPVAVRAAVSPDPSNIGDLLTLEIVAAYPRGYAVNLPTTFDLEPEHLVEVTQTEPESTGQGLRKTFQIRFQAFDIGEQRVRAPTVTYVDDAGAVHTLELPPITFTVDSLLANEAEPARKGEDPPVSIAYPNELAETITWSALATLLVALVGGWLLRRWLRRERVVPAPPPIPPHEVAYAALQELAQGDLLGAERYPDYYLQLTEITKAYLQGRFGVHALDRTTDEIRRDLVRDPKSVAPLSADEVIALLQRYDLVKFARFAPPREDAQEDLDEVRHIVDRSRPGTERPKEPEAAPEPDRKDDRT